MKLASIALTVLSMAAVLTADVWNKKTIITVSEPMQIPGKLLPAGTYVLKLVESQSNRHIVQVMNEREDKVEATIIAIPNLRLQPTGKSSFGFWETPAGTPRALRSWFYPGDNFGQEFAYPKDMAASLSSITKETVPALNESGNAATTAQAAAPAEVEVAKAEPVVEAAPAPVATPEPTPAPVAAAPAPEPTPAPAPAPAAAVEAPQAQSEQTRPSTLPATASPLAAIALGGLLLASAGKSISLYSKRN